MIIGNNDDVPWVVWLPAWRNKRCDKRVVVNDILLAANFVLSALNKQAKGTGIVFWFMIEHRRRPFFVVGYTVGLL